MSLLPFHIALMSAAFAMAVSASCIARFGRKTKWWLKAHRGMNIASLMFAVSGIALAFAMVERFQGEHFSTLHGKLGLLAVVWLMVQTLAGMLMLKPFMAPFAKKARAIHRWAGRLLVLLMLGNLILGISKFF